jgi:hypothetical protein
MPLIFSKEERRHRQIKANTSRQLPAHNLVPLEPLHSSPDQNKSGEHRSSLLSANKNKQTPYHTVVGVILYHHEMPDKELNSAAALWYARAR